MSVYVDNYRAPFRGMLMCHMMADSTAELLEMAAKIGVQAEWIQKRGTRQEHFDVCLTKRAAAVQHGAIEITAKELVSRMLARA